MTDDVRGIRFRDAYQGVDRTSYGYRMLSSLGWKEGDGLGAQGQGIKTHIKAVKKFDTSGLGAKEAAAKAQDWTIDMHNFATVLKGLAAAEVTSKHALLNAASEDGPDVAVETVIAIQSDGKKAKQRSKGGAPAKAVSVVSAAEEAAGPSKKRKRSAAEVLGEDRGGAAKGPKRPASTSHLGRYKKREQNKAVKGYSATDLAAILGHSEPSQFLVEVSAGASKAAEGSVAQPVRNGATQLAGVSNRPSSDKRPSVEHRDTTAEGNREDANAWWRTLYHRGGFVGEQKPEASGIAARAGFTEQDQTDLYNRAQSGRSQGRVGLGQSSLPKKVAGTRWQGTKTVLNSDSDFDDEGDAHEEEALEQAAETEEAYEANPIDTLPGGATIQWGTAERPAWFVAMQSASAPADCRGTGDVDGVGYDNSGVEMSRKAQKLCSKTIRKALKQGQQGAKVRQIVTQLLERLQDEGIDIDRAKLKRQVKAFVSTSDQWLLTKGSIIKAS